jgi:hypothetical protein
MDLRFAAEVLLRQYDALASAGRIKPLPEQTAGIAGPFHSRLKRRRSLDGLLTEFGLSPHPRLVLVVEGDTEELLLPRVMQLLGLDIEDDFISIQNAKGVDTDLAPLVAYAVAPRVAEERDGRYLTLLRPPTRILIVLDPEKRFATAASREERRQQWVDRLLETLPSDRRTAAVRQQLTSLVEVMTWRRNADSFEFAHFTDRQLARATARLDRGRRQPTPRKRLQIIARLRRQSAGLEPLLQKRVSKVKLADELWPVLERKIERALAAGTDQRIPIVRVVHRAHALAHEFPRRNFGIML